MRRFKVGTIFLCFLFLATPWCIEFLGQGSDQAAFGTYAAAAAMLDSLIHYAGSWCCIKASDPVVPLWELPDFIFFFNITLDLRTCHIWRGLSSFIFVFVFMGIYIISWICGLRYFITFGKFSGIISSNNHFSSILSFLSLYDFITCMLDTVAISHVSYTLSCIFHCIFSFLLQSRYFLLNNISVC